jgi:hypothetical protein
VEAVKGGQIEVAESGFMNGPADSHRTIPWAGLSFIDAPSKVAARVR